jgi:hypothetical protein
MLQESERKWNIFFDLIDKIIFVSAAILIIEGDFGIIIERFGENVFGSLRKGMNLGCTS